MTDARARGLWENGDFVKLWSAATISTFGTLITRTALPFAAILVLNATPFQIGLLSAVELAPQVLVGLVAGAWADRSRRRPLLIAADLGRAGMLVTIPATTVLGWLRIEHLYAVAFLTGLLTVFFDVADQSYLPTLIRRDQLLEGNSKLSATASVAEVGAFGVGGWLVQWLTAPMAILIDAVSFVASAVLIGRIRTPEPPAARDGHQNIWEEIGEGLSTVVGHPLLRAIAGCTLTAHLSFRIFGAVFLLYTTRELGFRPGVLGMVFAIGGVSSLAAALAAGRVSRALGSGSTMILGVIIMGVSMLLLPLARDASLLALACLVAQQIGDGGFAIYDITQTSLRQAITPPHVLGRANASLRFTALGAMLAGSLIGGTLGQTVGLRPTLTLAAAGVLISSVWLVVSPARRAWNPVAG